jgi:hypothetical protein
MSPEIEIFPLNLTLDLHPEGTSRGFDTILEILVPCTQSLIQKETATTILGES